MFEGFDVVADDTVDRWTCQENNRPYVVSPMCAIARRQLRTDISKAERMANENACLIQTIVDLLLEGCVFFTAQEAAAGLIQWDRRDFLVHQHESDGHFRVALTTESRMRLSVSSQTTWHTHTM